MSPTPSIWHAITAVFCITIGYLIVSFVIATGRI